MFLERRSPEITQQAVLAAIENPVDRRILALAQAGPIDAQTVIEATEFPKSTVYRRIQRLEDRGLLLNDGGRFRNGHAVARYRAAIEEVTLVVGAGEVEARWTPAPR